MEIFSLRTPLTVRGPFIRPEVGVEAGPLLARAGAAVLAAVAAPLHYAGADHMPAAEDDAHCAKLLARADEAVQCRSRRRGAQAAATRQRRASSEVKTGPFAGPLLPSLASGKSPR
jgi:hypothetical protein